MSPKNTPIRRRAPTSVDVAERAGVSQTTVSYVFNNTPGRTLRPETRERILKAARDLGYRPNSSARALKNGHTDEIVLFSVGPLRNISSAEFITSIQKRAHELGYALATYFAEIYSPTEWKGILESVFLRRPAGIITDAVVLGREDYRRAHRMGVTAWAVSGIDAVDYGPALLVPYEEAGRLAGIHFAQRGHKRIAYVVPRTITPVREIMLRNALRGLRSMLETQGATLTELVMDATKAEACAAIDLLRQSPDRPTAIYCFRDDFCFPLLKALFQYGLRVPEEMALIGTDDSPLCDLANPSVTSIRYDFSTFGSRLVDIVDTQIRGKKPTPELFLPPHFELIVREST